MSDNDKYQSGWYESDEGHAFHAHGKDMSPETLAALKKLADAAYKHLESLPDKEANDPEADYWEPLLDDDEDEEEETEGVCRDCGQLKELVPDTSFCQTCYETLGDDEYEDDSDEYFDEDWEDAGRCPRCMQIDCDGWCDGVWDGP